MVAHFTVTTVDKEAAMVAISTATPSRQGSGDSGYGSDGAQDSVGSSLSNVSDYGSDYNSDDVRREFESPQEYSSSLESGFLSDGIDSDQRSKNLVRDSLTGLWVAVMEAEMNLLRATPLPGQNWVNMHSKLTFSIFGCHGPPKVPSVVQSNLANTYSMLAVPTSTISKSTRA
ncbi:hypothetical protein PI126_g5367 [Phytophthora idaei]|nr:hypothetical protein PI126_g5367 [Phytophthora idaei]